MKNSSQLDNPSPDRFRRTLIRVLTVQAAALGILGLLQALYS
ncbi:hypothetical protein OAJ07_02105 [Gemmatimonadales bacterium]|nr:hypothetical protein [Gemmatimonadales bacterium]